MHPTTWKASGHVDAFNDPLIDNKDSKNATAPMSVVEDYCAKLEVKIDKEVAKAAKRFGDAFKSSVLSNQSTCDGLSRKIDSILKRD